MCVCTRVCVCVSCEGVLVGVGVGVIACMFVCVRAWCVLMCHPSQQEKCGRCCRARAGWGELGRGGLTCDIVTGVDLGRTDLCQIARETEPRSGPTDG